MSIHKLTLVVLGILMGLVAQSQTATISATNFPNPAPPDNATPHYDTVTYNVTYVGGTHTSTTWDTNGTTISSSTSSITIYWDDLGSSYIDAWANGSSGVAYVAKPITVVSSPCTEVAGTISNGDVTFCIGSEPTLSSTGESDSLDYQWMERQGTSGAFTAISGATSASYTPSGVTTYTEYVLEYTNQCVSSVVVYSDTVHLDPVQTVGGTIAGTTTRTATTSDTLTLSGHTGTVEKWLLRYKNGSGAWSSVETFDGPTTLTASTVPFYSN